MSALTIDQIINLLRYRTLPANYTIQTPCSISKEDLRKILSLFKNSDQMITFIDKLCHLNDASFIFDDYSIKLGTPEKFFESFALADVYDELDSEKRQAILVYLKNNPLSKYQLKYLINKVDPEFIRDLILSARCFSNDDLINICNDIDFIQKLSKRKIELLYYFINPERQWRESKTPLLDMYYFTQRVGHVLGISKKLKTKVRNIEIKIKSEGDYPGEALKLLSNYLDCYRQSYPSKVSDTLFYAIKDTCNLILKVDDIYKIDSHTHLFHRYQNNQLTYVATGWGSHAVGLAFYGDYIVYCNRGAGDEPGFGCKIYKINNTNLIDANYFKEISSTKTKEAFKRSLCRIIDFDCPLVTLPSKNQKRGVCSFVNAKACLKGMNVLVQAGPKARAEKVLKIAVSSAARTEYKHFTNFICNKEIDELIKNMFFAMDPDLIAYYAVLVKDIIVNHHGKGRGTDKDNQEVMRAIDLFERTPERIKKRIRSDMNFMTLMNKMRTENKTLIQAKSFKAEQLPQFQRHRDKRTGRDYKISINQGYITAINDKSTPKTEYSLSSARRLIRVIN